MYYLNALGYTHPPAFDTQKEALDQMKDFIADDKKRTSYRLAQINHSRTHKELRIGSRQGVHVYAEYWVTSD